MFLFMFTFAAVRETAASFILFLVFKLRGKGRKYARNTSHLGRCDIVKIGRGGSEVRIPSR